MSQILTARATPATARRTLAFASVLSLAGAIACGPKGEVSTPKIRNGWEVESTATGPERLSTVGLQGKQGFSTFSCSAGLLAPDLVVTAAHCVIAGAKVVAFFGTDFSGTGITIPVTGAVVDPDYAGATPSDGLKPHDVAVLRLARSAPASYVVPKVVDASEALASKEAVLLAGFGITEDGDGSGTLRAVETTLVGRDDAGRLSIDDPSKRGACSGDSGGPLFVKRDGQYLLAGVLSGGPIPCRGVNVYTPLGQHAAFLASATKTLHASR